MRLRANPATFEFASSDPKTVQRRELVRTWLAAIAVLVVMLLVGVFVLSEGLGGNLLYQR